MEKNELADRLEGIATDLRLVAHDATKQPGSLANVYLSGSFDLLPSMDLIDAARQLRAPDVEAALELVREHRNRLAEAVEVLTVYPDPDDWNVVARDAAAAMESIKAIVCPALNAAAARLRAGQEAAENRRKRATKADTALKVQAAIVYKAEHPEAAAAEVALKVGIPRTTLEAKREWQSWCLKVERAATSNDGSLATLQAAADKRTGEIVAYHKVTDDDD